MLAVCLFDHGHEPAALFERVCGEIEHDSGASLQKVCNVGREQVLQAFGVGHIIRHSLHFWTVERFEPVIFAKKNSVRLCGQGIAQRRFTRANEAADEVEVASYGHLDVQLC